MPSFKLPGCDYKVIIFYPYNILNDSSGKFMRKAEVNHRALVTVNRVQETAGFLRLLCKDLCHEEIPGRVSRIVGILVHCSTKNKSQPTNKTNKQKKVFDAVLGFCYTKQATGNQKDIYKG